MSKEIVILGKESNPLVKEIIEILEIQGIEYYFVCSDLEKLTEFFINESKGFIIIICLPPSHINILKKKYGSSLEPFFKIYYYYYINTVKFEYKIFLWFDFIIVGKLRKKSLFRTIEYLKNNYWRKIPVHIIKGTDDEYSPLFHNILFIISFLKDEKITVKKIADHLRIKENIIIEEIKKNSGLNFSEFKKKILEYLNRQEY